MHSNIINKNNALSYISIAGVSGQLRQLRLVSINKQNTGHQPNVGNSFSVHRQ